MLITRETRFLLLPIHPDAPRQKLYFSSDSKLLLDLDVQLDAQSPGLFFLMIFRILWGRILILLTKIGQFLPSAL